MVRPIAAPLTGPGRVLVDPAEASGAATSAIDWYHPSPDGTLVAFGTSIDGDERSTLRIVEVATGQQRPDTLPHTRAASVAWLPDNRGFAYTRYPDPAAVGDDEAGYHRHVWWHHLGDPATADTPCFTDLPEKEAWPDVSLSHDGRWLLVHVQRGWSQTEVHLLDRETNTWTTVVAGIEAATGLRVDLDRHRLIGETTLGAPKGRLVSLPLEGHPPRSPGGGEPAVVNPQALITELVAEADDILAGFAITNPHLLVVRTRAGVSSLHHHDPDGTHRAEVTALTGGLAAVTALAAHPSAPGIIAIGHTSFTRPDTVTAWRPEAEPIELTRLPCPPIAATTVTQLRYPSTDATAVPMLLVHATATAISHHTPTLLTGYGGFNITETPAWSPFVATWCELGGQVAIPGIRGGGEEGEAWHEAGRRANKPQVFADFEAAADWLVAEGRTSRARLAIRGGSNGGLLVAACLTRRPDLCAAVVCDVPLTDMVRFPRFLIARLWIPEYGDPDVPEELAWLHAYSPYHQVVDGTAYPAVLITTGEQDSRVDPCHARKMAARLQAASTALVLLRVEPAAGHGQGKPAGQQTEERADVLAFLAWQLGLEP